MTGDPSIGLNKVKQDSIFWVPRCCSNFVDPQNEGADCLEVLSFKFSEENCTEIVFLLCYWNSRELGIAIHLQWLSLKLLKEIPHLLKFLNCSNYTVQVYCSGVTQFRCIIDRVNKAPYNLVLLAQGLLIWGLVVLCCGAVLCTVGCAESLASTHKCYDMLPWGAKYPLSQTAVLAGIISSTLVCLFLFSLSLAALGFELRVSHLIGRRSTG
jgi:hypothetical protein